MPVTTKWDMLVPQPDRVVHNLIRNPGFEYSNTFFAGNHQYWWYDNNAGTRNRTTLVEQTSDWASMGSRALKCSLDGVSYKRAVYSPLSGSFEDMGMVADTGSPAIINATSALISAVTYTAGAHYACVMALSPYGCSLAVTNDDVPVQSGNTLLGRSGHRQIDLLRGHSVPFFTPVFNATGAAVAVKAVSYSFYNVGLPSPNDFDVTAFGWAIFWSTPTLSASGKRIWRLLDVQTTVNVPSGGETLMPADTSQWAYGSTVFLTDGVPGSLGNYYVYDANGNEVRADFIGMDSTMPSLNISPASVESTYDHHLYLEWYVEANYTSGTSPFIACAYDYAVTLYDRTYGVTYTPVNYETGTNRLAAQPTNRSLALRQGRTKFLLAPPDDSVNSDAGRNLELRIEIISPTGSYTNNAAVLYLDNVQLVDITYRSDDSVNWDDVEFTYLDGDVAGAEWHDFAPSWKTSSGTVINGINSAWTWLGYTYAGWSVSYGQANRDRLVEGTGVTTNVYGGSAITGYSQSSMRTEVSGSGIYVPIDNDNLGASVNTTTTGVGMPEVVTSVQAYGLIDGGIVQRQVANMRTFQLSIDVTGNSAEDLHNKRRQMINALKFDQLSTQGTRTVRYRGSGTHILFNVTYTAGLEFTGNVGVSFAESATIQFLGADPYAYAERQVASRMSLNLLLQDTRYLVAYRLGDNLPWQYTAMKDYQALAVGNGTITTVSASPQVNGTGTAFTTDDIGKEVYYVANTTGLTLLGTIGTYNAVTGTNCVRFVANTTAVVTNQAYFLKTPTLNWAGGSKKYHLGFIASPTGTLSLIVGGFDNGSPALGYGFSKYLAIIPLDGKQNQTAGNYTNITPRSGSITFSTASATVTGVGTDFSPADVGNDIYEGTSTLVGRILAWNSATSVTLYGRAAYTGTAFTWGTRNTEITPNSDYSNVRPLLAKSIGNSDTRVTLIPVGAITCIYQESATSVLIAGNFSGYTTAGWPITTGIRLIRVKGYVARSTTTSSRGAPDAFGLGDEDIEVLAWDSYVGWGTPTINAITVDSAGNIIVGGFNFTTSNVWYIGRADDGSYATVYQPLGVMVDDVLALTTDNRFPIANIFAAIDVTPYLEVYPYYNARNSTGVWKTPPFDAFGGQQAPNDLIYSLLRTQSGDILAAGQFDTWGGVSVNGLARIVYKITTATQSLTTIDASPAVPVGGSFAQPGVADVSTTSYVTSMADYSYPINTGAYSGIGERIAFGGYFSRFADGRSSLAFGYLEGSGNSSSVRRMSTSDAGLPIPLSVADYPIVQAIATSTRQRFYYENNQTTKTDGLNGTSIAMLVTKSTSTTPFASNIRLYQSGTSGYALTNNYGVQAMVNASVYVRGNANPYPIITCTLFWRSSLYEITNAETGARIKFDDLYGIRGVQAFSGTTETITLDMRPGYRSITSNIRGNLMGYVSPDSDLSDFYLLAPYTTNDTADTTRLNTLVFRYSIVHDTVGSTTPTVPRITIAYTPKFWSFDVPRLFMDEPDTPLM